MTACSGRALVLEDTPADDPRAPSIDGGTVETLHVQEKFDEFWVDDTLADTHIFWSSAFGKVRSCAYDDCAHTTITYGDTYFAGIGLGANAIYWSTPTSPATALSCPKSGCVGAPTRVVQDPWLMPGDFVADGDYLYWPSAFDTYRCPVTGCGDIPELVVRDEAVIPQFSGSYAYWARASGFTDEGKPRSSVEIRRASKDGSGAATIRTLPSNFVAFAVDANSLYWIDDHSQIASCPLESCASGITTPLVTTDVQKYEFRVDSSGLYWQEGRDGNIGWVVKYCPLNGCQGDPQTLIDESVMSFAFDSKYLYWHDFQSLGGGSYTAAQSIHRIPKPRP